MGTTERASIFIQSLWRSVYRRTAIVKFIRYAVVVAIFICLLLVIWLVPFWQAQMYGEVRAETVDRFRATLSQIIGGLVLLYGVYLTSRRIAAAEAQAAAATNNIRLIEAGQVNERFSRAIDQLGSSNDQIHIRMGGIFALQSIAREQPTTHEWTIIEILTAFVRDRSSEIRQNIGADNFDPAEHSPPRSNDLNAAVDVACTLIRLRKRLDVEQIVHLEEALLTGANLEGAHLAAAFLAGADLRGAALSMANLNNAVMHAATFNHAMLNDADLSGADLTGADLSGANLSGADLSGANLKFADLSGTNLSKANLKDAKLNGAKIRNANLGAANFKFADLSGADFTSANLDQTILEGAYVPQANFHLADDLSCTQLMSAIFWEEAYRDSHLACGASIPARPT